MGCKNFNFNKIYKHVYSLTLIIKNFVNFKLKRYGIIAMAIKKRYLKTKPICKVTFKFEPPEGRVFHSVFIVGDFNDWDEHSHRLKKLVKDDTYSIVIDLEKGKEYQFRYLLDGKEWGNEPAADKHVPTHFGDSENSVVVV